MASYVRYRKHRRHQGRHVAGGVSSPNEPTRETSRAMKFRGRGVGPFRWRRKRSATLDSMTVFSKSLVSLDAREKLRHRAEQPQCPGSGSAVPTAHSPGSNSDTSSRHTRLWFRPAPSGTKVMLCAPATRGGCRAHRGRTDGFGCRAASPGPPAPTYLVQSAGTRLRGNNSLLKRPDWTEGFMSSKPASLRSFACS